MYSDLQTIAPEQYMKTITARLTELYAVSVSINVATIFCLSQRIRFQNFSSDFQGPMKVMFMFP